MLIDDIIDFLFPRSCVICGKRLTTQEHYLCLPCYMHLPRTQYHTVEHNDMERLFWGYADRLPIGQAVSFFHYNDSTKRILMQLKYQKNPHIGEYLAGRFVQELQADSTAFFDGIDIIIPIPLHWIRRLGRSYNQSEHIAQGISKATGIPVSTKVVRRVVNNKSQTLMKKHERRDNVSNIFRLIHPEHITGKHILIVDDVTTTGSTVASCAQELAKAQNIKVSVLTLAIAGQTPGNPNDDQQPLPYISVTTDQLAKL